MVLTHFWSCLSWIPWWVMIYMSLEGVILSFVRENWQNLPFLGRTRNSVPVPKREVPVPMGQRQSGTSTDQSGIGTHSLEKGWYRYRSKWYQYQCIQQP